MTRRRIGIDFDNTLADYDEVMHEEALRRGLIRAGVGKSKRRVREAVRALPGGDLEWQKLQARVYGSRMPDARLMDGVRAFFASCRERNVSVAVVSHRSAHYRFDDTGTDFRRAAIEWMEARGFFDPHGFGMDRAAVCFEDTRRDKVGRIRERGFTHFIDDLPEVFLEDTFPAGTEKILLSADVGGETVPPDARVMMSWEEITDYFFS